MRKYNGLFWTLILVCFMTLVGCAHDQARTPAAASSHDLRSGTTTNGGLSDDTEDMIERNHGGGREGMIDHHQQLNLPQLQVPQFRTPASEPLLAGFAPVMSVGTTTANANIQPSYGWFLVAVGLLFALIYGVRRSNARPDDQEPKFRA